MKFVERIVYYIIDWQIGKFENNISFVLLLELVFFLQISYFIAWFLPEKYVIGIFLFFIIILLVLVQGLIQKIQRGKI